jgi:hypothetical protein
MTTEFPSGETFTAAKLTELKNSSSVSLGFAVWALAKIEAEITETSEKNRIARRIEDRINFSITAFNSARYTPRALQLANGRLPVRGKSTHPPAHIDSRDLFA